MFLYLILKNYNLSCKLVFLISTPDVSTIVSASCGRSPLCISSANKWWCRLWRSKISEKSSAYSVNNRGVTNASAYQPLSDFRTYKITSLKFDIIWCIACLLHFAWGIATSSFHHHVSLCLQGPFDIPHMCCAVSIIIFFMLCQCLSASRCFHSSSSTLSLTMPLYSSQVCSSFSFHARTIGLNFSCRLLLY